MPETAPAAVGRGTEDLGEAFEPEARFENPDGTPIRFDTDYHGEKASVRIPGPFIK